MRTFSIGAGCFVALLLIGATAHADPAPPATATPAAVTTAAPAASSNAPFEHKPKPPSDRVALQLEDAELGELVRVIGEITGKRFVIASPKLAKVKASIYAPQKVTVAEAYQAFLAVLTANGLTVVPQAGFYKIVESADVARQLTPFERGELSNEERYVTRIHRLAHLSAEDVATSVLSKLQTKDASIVPYNNLLIITETAANLRRMLEVLSVVDEGGEEDKIWLRPVKYLSAAQAEKQLNDMLGTKGSKDGAKPEATITGGALHVGRLVALERPNAIVLVGTRESFDRVTRILDVIDIAPTNEIKVTVVPLQHSDAKKIVGPINEVLGAGSPVAQAAQGAQQRGGSGSAGPATPSAVLEGQVKVAADETTNSLIVTATSRDYTYVMEMIKALDKPKRQVFIEAAILDISAERGLDVGVAWHGGHIHDAAIGPGGAQQTTYGGFRSGTSALPPSATDLQAFALGVRGPEIPFLGGIPGLSRIPSFGAFLSAIATQKGADILSTPTILASDNTMAEIKVQLQTSLQPNAPSFSPALLGAAGAAGVPGLPGAFPTSSNVSANYKGIGPHIKVTPHLNDSDEVRLDVIEVISDVQSAPGPGDTFGTVSYIERTATTTLTVRDGRTVVIGGLVRNRVSRTETKVPILGDIPLLGGLFRTRGDKLEKSNLVLVLTPHIIRDESDMRRIYERKMEERQELIDREAVFKGTEWAAPHDWKKTRGLLAHINASQRDVVARRKEAEERDPKAIAAAPVAPLDLPVPQSPQNPAPPPRNSAPPPATPAVGAVPTAARPAVIEK